MTCPDEPPGHKNIYRSCTLPVGIRAPSSAPKTAGRRQTTPGVPCVCGARQLKGCPNFSGYTCRRHARPSEGRALHCERVHVSYHCGAGEYFQCISNISDSGAMGDDASDLTFYVDACRSLMKLVSLPGRLSLPCCAYLRFISVIPAEELKLCLRRFLPPGGELSVTFSGCRGAVRRMGFHRSKDVDY